MKLQENSIPLLDNARTERRLFSGLIDFAIMCILEFAIFLGVIFQIIKIIPAYTTADAKREYEMNILYDMSAEAKLIVKKDDGTICKENEMFYRYVYKEILLSYNENRLDFINDGINEIDNPYGVSPSSKDENELIYFFTQYAYERNLLDYEGLEPLEYFVTKIGSSFNLDKFFIIDETYQDIPVLKSSVAITYYKELKDNKINELNDLYEYYVGVFKKASILVMDQPEYKEHYKIYEDAYFSSISYIAGGILLSHTVSYLIVYLIIPLFAFGYGSTIGRRILKIVIVDGEKEISKAKIVLNAMLYYLQSYFSVFISFGLFFGLNMLNAPLFIAGSLQINNSLFSIISLILFIISYSFIFRKSLRTLNDSILSLDFKDARHFIQGK